MYSLSLSLHYIFGLPLYQFSLISLKYFFSHSLYIHFTRTQQLCTPTFTSSGPSFIIPYLSSIFLFLIPSITPFPNSLFSSSSL